MKIMEVSHLNNKNRGRLLLQKWQKSYARLERKISNGTFKDLKIVQQDRLLKKLRRYYKQLQRMNITPKQMMIGSSLVLSLILSKPIQAQTFTEQTGANNPFDGLSINAYPAPNFVDIDDDNDLDVFVGQKDGTIKYFKNTGTVTSPTFTEQTGSDNPFDGVNVGGYSFPAVVDIDNDGDFDIFSGRQNGKFNYYKNTGTKSNPIFTAQTGTDNPLNGIDVSEYSTVSFVDIDDDGDFDAFFGGAFSSVKHYKNTGTNTSPTFANQSGASNPLNGASGAVEYAAAAFVDIDGDGDFDVFIGSGNGLTKYYKNTGSKSSATFVEQTGANNPFDGVDVGSYSYPDFVDIDNDGDFDVFIGESTGTIKYYQNTTALPVELLSFSVEATEKGNILKWQTATEINNSHFDVEWSKDGLNFIKIGEVVGAGSMNEVQFYDFLHRNPVNGENYYRLKQVDFDGKFEYTNTIQITIQQSNNSTIKVFPNPASHFLKIESEHLIGEIVQIFNVNGQLMKEFQHQSLITDLPITNLPSGTYFIKVGQEVKKVIVQK